MKNNARKTDSSRVGFLFLVFLCFNSSCYLLEQGSRLLDDRANAKPLDYFSKENSDTETLDLIERVKNIKDFAKNTLNFKISKNFSKITVTNKDHLTRVVNACEAFSFKNYTWWFPFFGEAPYLGFYNDKSADEEAKSLKDKGYDVFVRDVEAFSTLGALEDPLYSYMSKFNNYRLANLIFHEETHANWWIDGEFEFNEQFATFMGDKIASFYIIEKFGAIGQDIIAKIKAYDLDIKTWYADLAQLKTKMQDLYANFQNKTDLEKLTLKNSVYESFRTNFLNEYSLRYQTPYFKDELPLVANNAFIQLYSLYTENNDVFEKAFEKYGSDILGFIEYLKKFNGKALKIEIERLASL